MVTTATEVNAAYTPLKSNSSSKSTSKLVLLLLVGLFLVATIVLGVLLVGEKTKKSCNKTSSSADSFFTDDGDVCLSPYCVKTAGSVLQNMDDTVDPCENFYQFTCGSWMKDTKLSSSIAIESSTTKLRDKMYEAIIDLLSSPLSNETNAPKSVLNARRLYSTCVNEDDADDGPFDEFILSLTKEFTDWLKQPSSTIRNFNLYFPRLLLKFNQYNSFPFYQIKTVLDSDHIETLKYRIRITPGHYRQKDDEESLFVGEHPFVKYFDEFHPESTTTSEPTLQLEQLKSEIDHHLKWTNAVAYTDDITTTVKNLTQIINSTFDFSNYIRRLYRSANINLTNDDTVVIGRIDDIRSIAKILPQYPPKTLFLYIMRQFFVTHAFHLSKHLRSLFGTSLLSSSSEDETRELTCAKFVNKFMGYAVSKLYIGKYFDRVARQESIDIVQNVRETFIEMIRTSKWMDGISKKRTIEKAEAILGKIGYPAHLDDANPTKLDAMYREHQFTSSHFANALLLFRIHVKSNLQKLRRTFDHDDWPVFTPTTINAFYLPILNDIIFPAAFLQPPFFHKDAPKYMNYGAIGTTVGHEITHGFDEMCRHLDKDRKNYTFWSNETANTYDKRSKCLIDQYNNYKITAINRTLNGNDTLDENISDNDGLRKAFYAYEKWRKEHPKSEKKLPGLTKYSEQQMFFISFGQIWCSKMSDDYVKLYLKLADHAPHSFRLIGSTSNFVEFDRAFSCKPGQGNSRVNKCKVW